MLSIIAFVIDSGGQWTDTHRLSQNTTAIVDVVRTVIAMRRITFFVLD